MPNSLTAHEIIREIEESAQLDIDEAVTTLARNRGREEACGRGDPEGHGGHGMSARLRAPFPYYGSKIGAAGLIERLMGPINNLVIPFAGSLGELLGRSEPAKVETVNDLDGFVVNAWRGLAYSPEQMAELCDHPVHETTLHAAHDLLLASAEQLPELLRSNPRAHDVELAAWWVWGASCWIGSGWCQSTNGPPRARGRVRVQGREGTPNHGQGVAKPLRGHEKRPAIAGQGERPHQGRGVARPLPLLRGSDGSGVGYGAGVHSGTNREALLQYFAALARRLRFVRITCGEWPRVCTPAVTTSHGVTGISFDPPYEHHRRAARLYRHDAPNISAEVRETARRLGPDPLLRITLCGKGDEHDELLDAGWSRHEWRPDGEVIWASPHCVRDDFGPLFATKMEAAQ